jgi:hypothetical protein
VFVSRSTDHSLYHGKLVAAESFLTQRLKATSRAKKRLIVDPKMSFIAGPKLDLATQVVTAFDVNTGPEWFDGLNKSTWEGEKLSAVCKDLVCMEIDGGGFRITPMRPDRGVGVLTPHAFRDGDKIMKLSCLWFDKVPMEPRAPNPKSFPKVHGAFEPTRL